MSQKLLTFKSTDTEPYLTQEEIDQFKKIFKKVYGIELTDEQALNQGSRLVKSFELDLIHKKHLENPFKKEQND